MIDDALALGVMRRLSSWPASPIQSGIDDRLCDGRAIFVQRLGAQGTSGIARLFLRSPTMRYSAHVC